MTAEGAVRRDPNVNKFRKIVELMQENPSWTSRKIAREVDSTPKYVRTVRFRARQRGLLPVKHPTAPTSPEKPPMFESRKLQSLARGFAILYETFNLAQQQENPDPSRAFLEVLEQREEDVQDINSKLPEYYKIAHEILEKGGET